MKIWPNIFYLIIGLIFFIFGFRNILIGAQMIAPHIYEYVGTGILFLLIGVIYLLFWTNFLKINVWTNISLCLLVLVPFAGFLPIWGFIPVGRFGGGIFLLGLYSLLFVIGIAVSLIKKLKNK